MKKLVIISALLFLALGLSAQNNTGRKPREKKTTVTETKKETTTTRTKPTTSTPTSVNKPDRTTPAPPAGNKTNARESRTPANTGNADRTRQSTTPANREVRTPDNRNKTVTPSNTNRTNENATRGPSRENSSARPPRTTGGNTHVTNTTTKITYDPKRGQTYTEERRVYVNPAPRRVVRPAPHITYVQQPIEYRRVHNAYRMPPNANIIWNENMYHQYVVLYPDFHLWYYPYGYAIHSISSYDAAGYIGEIARVYGMVYDTWYSPETDEYFLYFGGPYPYQDFSVVLEGRDARRFSRRPDRYFANRYISVTGLVSLWENKPEIDVKQRSQVQVY